MPPYFVTGGRGTGIFTTKELKRLDNSINQISAIDGKVFFTSNVEPSQLLQLKSVERLFVQVCYYKGFRIDSHDSCSSDIGVKKLQYTIESIDSQIWSDALSTWREVQTACVCSSNQEPGIGHCPLDTSNSPLDTPPQKKQRLDQQSQDSEVHVEEKYPDGLKNEDWSDEERPSSDDDVTFRVSSKISGHARKFGKTEVMNAVLNAVKSIGWQSTTHDPLVEVYCQLNDEHLVIGIPCTRKPLSERPYIKNIRLRSTICWSMAFLACVKENDTVLDPMCGAATLLVESVKSFNVQNTIGCDISDQQLEVASSNIKYANVCESVSLIKADVRAIPLPNSSVDVILCDTPFGYKHGMNCQQVCDLYPDMLSEMCRVLRPGGRIAILTSETLLESLIKAIIDMECQDNGSEKQISPPANRTAFTANSNEDNFQCITTEKESEPPPKISPFITYKSESICQPRKHLRNCHVKIEQSLSPRTNCKLTTVQYKEFIDKLKANIETDFCDESGLFSGDFKFKQGYFLKLGETRAYVLLLTKRVSSR